VSRILASASVSCGAGYAFSRASNQRSRWRTTSNSTGLSRCSPGKRDIAEEDARGPIAWANARGAEWRQRGPGPPCWKADPCKLMRSMAASARFLRLLQQLRIVLHDPVVMKGKFSANPIWADPVFARDDCLASRRTWSSRYSTSRSPRKFFTSSASTMCYVCQSQDSSVSNAPSFGKFSNQLLKGIERSVQSCTDDPGSGVAVAQ